VNGAALERPALRLPFFDPAVEQRDALWPYWARTCQSRDAYKFPPSEYATTVFRCVIPRRPSLSAASSASGRNVVTDVSTADRSSSQ
jgi:hypothetical protein